LARDTLSDVAGQLDDACFFLYELRQGVDTGSTVLTDDEWFDLSATANALKREVKRMWGNVPQKEREMMRDALSDLDAPLACVEDAIIRRQSPLPDGKGNATSVLTAERALKLLQDAKHSLSDDSTCKSRVGAA
jgi:hypothetical protein